MGWRRARRISAGVALALLAGLVVTGVDLWQHYRPSSIGLPTAQAQHRWLSQLLLPVVVVVAVTSIGAARRPARASWVALPIVGLVVVAGITGYLLPWDQLALWAVTVGTNLQGMSPLFDDAQVRFVLVGGAEVPLATYRRWAVVHLVAAVLLVAALVAALLWPTPTTAVEPEA